MLSYPPCCSSTPKGDFLGCLFNFSRALGLLWAALGLLWTALERHAPGVLAAPAAAATASAHRIPLDFPGVPLTFQRRYPSISFRFQRGFPAIALSRGADREADPPPSACTSQAHHNFIRNMVRTSQAPPEAETPL